MKKLLFIFLLICLLPHVNAQKTEVIIDEINNTKGVIRVAVYKNQKTFSAEQADQLLTFSKDKMREGKMSVFIDLPIGTYGVSILDDQNKNAEMDYGMFGIPKEGYAFSNFYHSSMSMPKFDSFKFETSKTNKVYCKMRYW